MVLGCCDNDQAGGLPLQALPYLLQHQGLHFPHLGHTGSTCESFVPTVLPGWKPVLIIIVIIVIFENNSFSSHLQCLWRASKITVDCGGARLNQLPENIERVTQVKKNSRCFICSSPLNTLPEAQWNQGSEFSCFSSLSQSMSLVQLGFSIGQLSFVW